ncbi:MAG TPA: hypothetical protein GX499_03800 [Clostridiales bacterium]|nr:hypothetical protein [Clostridiales bacterium]
MLELGLFFLAGMTLLAASNRALPCLLAMAGDEDMKIAGDSFKPAPPDAGEAEAKAYLEQKSSGNVEKARRLGSRFALALRERVSENLNDPNFQGELAVREHHKAVLYSYVVNRVIADLSPNSILAQTALNVFYADLEAETPVLAEHVRDMAAYSLYILCERSETCVDDEIGRIYARLCGEEDNPRRVEEGNRCYREFYHLCSLLHQQTEYV